MKKVKKKVIVSEDIIEYGILPRLPAKSLIRFQGVSKRWRALISTDDRFLRLQSNHARSSPALLLFGETTKPVFLSHAEGEEEGRKSPSSIGFPDICSQLRFGGPQPDWIPLAACGEFLCAAITSSRDTITKLYLGNPVWGHWIPLPAPPKRVPRHSPCTMGLVVVSSSPRHAYKLFMPVCMNMDGGRIEVSFWVLSSTGPFWEHSGPYVLLNSWTKGFEFESNVCVEGIYFWRAVGEVLWLDPKEKEARGGTIPLPPFAVDADADDEFWIIGEWDGKLSFMILIDWRIHLWSWDHRSSSWSFRILITVADIARGNPHLFTSMGLRMNLRNRNAEPLDVILARTRSSILAFGVGFILLKVNFGALCYDATTGKAWKLNRRLWGCDTSTRPFAYVNSLLKLKIIPLLITPWLQN